MAGNGVRASAPAKVILFGEHSVGYGAPAIAAAIEKRTVVEILPSLERKISFNFPSINESINWEIPANFRDNPQEQSKSAKCARLVTERFSQLFELVPGMEITATSNQPIGAGLGSSASFTVALCAAFYTFESVLNNIAVDPPTFTQSISDKVMNLAFECEKIFHGNPSGLDTSVATVGGIIKFQKNIGVDKMGDCLPVKLVVVDSEVSRNTSVVVKKLRDFHDLYPAIIDKAVDAMRAVCEEAAEEIRKPTSVHKLIDLCRINHGLLCTLGVSHVTLERMKIALDGLDVGFKLTGAGCGGNAIVLVPHDIDEQVVINKLHETGFKKTMVVTCGGPGLQVELIRKDI